jgi:hypothetical protein
MNDSLVFNSIMSHSWGYSMGAVWQSLTVELAGTEVSFDRQTEMFFSLLKTLMIRGEIRLALDGRCLEGSMDDQLDVLRRAWPSSREKLESEMGLWFLVESPAGIVWITPDGKEVWS